MTRPIHHPSAADAALPPLSTPPLPRLAYPSLRSHRPPERVRLCPAQRELRAASEASAQATRVALQTAESDFAPELQRQADELREEAAQTLATAKFNWERQAAEAQQKAVDAALDHWKARAKARGPAASPIHHPRPRDLFSSPCPFPPLRSPRISSHLLASPLLFPRLLPSHLLFSSPPISPHLLSLVHGCRDPPVTLPPSVCCAPGDDGRTRRCELRGGPIAQDDERGDDRRTRATCAGPARRQGRLLYPCGLL